MDVAERPIGGQYEDQGEIKENLRLAEPENEDEKQAIASAILEQEAIVDGDIARRDYEFRYRLGDYLGNGLYALQVEGADQSGRRHGVEIAAGLAISGAAGAKPPSIEDGIPMWFLSDRIHNKVVEGTPNEYDGTAFGRLSMADAERLPQRWLFGAPAGA